MLVVEGLIKRFGGRVSYERILSGPGIGNLYDFFRQRKRIAESAANAKLIAEAKDRNACISALGASRKSLPAAQAIDLFASLYGAEAGNLALKAFAIWVASANPVSSELSSEMMARSVRPATSSMTMNRPASLSPMS